MRLKSCYRDQKWLRRGSQLLIGRDAPAKAFQLTWTKTTLS